MSLIDKIAILKQVLTTILKVADIVIKVVEVLIESLKGGDING